MCVSATYVNVKEADMICVRAGLFHGTDALCKIKSSKEVAHAHPRWDDLLEFDISYTDLPRGIDFTHTHTNNHRIIMN